MKRISTFLALLLTGCASSSGVFPVGPDTYRVTGTAITTFGGSGTASRSAIDAATGYCASQGRTLVVVDSTASSGITQGDASVTFRCVTPAAR